MFFSPFDNWRHVEVTNTRTQIDFAYMMKYLVDVCYPDADIIQIVMDNLNTHTAAALYKAFPPPEARRIVQRLQFHHTPKHGSWLNMAEIELSILKRQCLDRRIADQETLKKEIEAWQNSRNAKGCTTNWRFTTQDARIKLKRLYPSI